MNLSRVVVIVAVTAAIVYAGLNFLLPKHGKAGGAAAVAEAGFGTEAAAPAAETAPATEVASTDTAAAEAPAADSSEAPAAEAPAAETAEAAGDAPALSDEEARAIAANVASEAADGGAAPAGGESAASGLTDAQRAAIAANVASEGSGDAAEPTPPPAAAAPAPAPSKPAAAAAPASAPNNGADVISAWWKQAGASGGLNLVYAGESTKDKAVVLIFDAEVDAAAAGSSIKLVDGKGGSPSGSWTNGNNGRVLAFKGVTPGRYTVIVGAGVASTSGKSVGKELVGPVYVR